MYVFLSLHILHVVITQMSRSRNLTVRESPGRVSEDDPTYASIPPDSRKPPAPIDPSSESHRRHEHMFMDNIYTLSFEVVLHFICYGLGRSSKDTGRVDGKFHIQFVNHIQIYGLPVVHLLLIIYER